MTSLMTESQPNRSRKALFVDDNDLIRSIMGEVLRDYGFDVLEAGSGAEALALIDDSVDLMIADIHLPDMLGNVLAVNVRKRYPSLPIILATGGNHAHPNSSEHVEDAVLLNKPYDLQALIRAVEQAGDRPN
jgi:CheY-like chemotaxis protein